MDVALVGSGPAVEALEAAFTDVEVDVVAAPPDRLGEFRFAAVVDTAGADAFAVAAERADRWVAVEVGGLGGSPLADVDATVSLFDEDSGCYECLRQRVAAAADGDDLAETPRGVRSAVRFAGAVAGRRAIQLLSGADLAGTVVEVPGAERSFAPVPGCACDPGRDRELEVTHRDVVLEDALERGERAVDDRLGLLTEVGERDSYPVPYYLAATADTTPFSDTRCAEFAAGCDPDWNRAYMKAVGEGLERYCAGVYDAEGFRTGTTEALDGAVSPNRFVASAGDDERSNADRPWVRARDLVAEAEAWLPAELVHYPPPETRIKPPITTGLGLGNTTVEAVLSGLYEVIERDAAMLSWYSTFEPMGLAVEHDGFRTLCRRASAEGLELTPLLLTQDVDLPVVGVAAHREGDWPRFAMGSGADCDPGAAAHDAAAEALQNWMELRAMGPDQAAEEGAAIGEYADFPDPAREYVAVDSDLPAETVAVDHDGGADELDAVLDRVAEAGLEAYAARITTRDVESLGFEAVRVVVPEAQPLFTGDPFFGDRLDTVPASMGFEARPDRPYHPFP